MSHVNTLPRHPCGLVVESSYRKPAVPFTATPVYRSEDVVKVERSAIRPCLTWTVLRQGSEPVAYQLSELYYNGRH
jgi:hypothetical protein